MSKKEIYIVYDDEKASANLKENGNLVKTVTVKKDVDRNRDSYEMLCTIRNELFKEDTKFKIGDRVRFKDYINIDRQFDFHNMFINDTSSAINFRKMFIELEGKLGTVIDIDKKTLKVKIKVDSFSDEEVIALGVVRNVDVLVAHIAISHYSKNLWFDNFCVELYDENKSDIL